MARTSLKAELDSHALIHRALRDMAPPKARDTLSHSFDMFELGLQLGAAVAAQRVMWRLHDLLKANASESDYAAFARELGAFAQELDSDLGELCGEDDPC